MTKTNSNTTRCDVVVRFCDPVSTFDMFISSVILNRIDFAAGSQLSRGHLTSRTDIGCYSLQSEIFHVVRNPPFKIGKQLHTFPSAESLGMPSRAGSCRGNRINSYTSRRVSTLICLWCCSAREDHDSFGGIGNNVTCRTAIDAGLLRWLQGRFPRVRYTSHTFLSPKKLVRCV